MLPAKPIIDAMVQWSQDILNNQVPGTARVVYEYPDAQAFQEDVPCVVCEGWLENSQLPGGYCIRLAPVAAENMPTHYIAAFPYGDNELVVYLLDNLVHNNRPETLGMLDPGLTFRMFMRAVIQTNQDIIAFAITQGSTMTTQCLAYHNARNPIHYVEDAPISG